MFSIWGLLWTKLLYKQVPFVGLTFVNSIYIFKNSLIRIYFVNGCYIHKDNLSKSYKLIFDCFLSGHVYYKPQVYFWLSRLIYTTTLWSTLWLSLSYDTCKIGLANGSRPKAKPEGQWWQQDWRGGPTPHPPEAAFLTADPPPTSS